MITYLANLQRRVHTRASFVLGFFLRVFGAADIKNVEGGQPAPLLFDLVHAIDMRRMVLHLELAGYAWSERGVR